MEPGTKLLTVILITLVIAVHAFPLRVEVTSLLYHVSAARLPGAYVSPVAPAITLKVTPSALLYHLYVNTPSPVGVTLISGTGAVFSHIVWSIPIDPGTKLLTVTFIVFDSSVHVFSPMVEVAWRLYQVSAASAPGAYVARVAPPIAANVVPSMLFSHWYVNVPSPEAAATDVNAAGVSPSHIVWAVPMVPGVKLLTVILTALVIRVHELPLSVEVTCLWYHVSAVSAAGA